MADKPYRAHFDIRPATPVPGWPNPDGMYGPTEWMSVETDDPEEATRQWLKTNRHHQHRLRGVRIFPNTPLEPFSDALRGMLNVATADATGERIWRLEARITALEARVAALDGKVSPDRHLVPEPAQTPPEDPTAAPEEDSEALPR